MEHKTKSKIWQSEFFNGDQLEGFRDDIKYIKEVEFSRIPQIFDFVKNIIITQSKIEEQKLINEAVSRGLVDNHSEIWSFYRVINYFLKEFNIEENKNDTPDILINDISNNLNINQNELDTVKKLLEMIVESTKWYDDYKLKQTISSGLLPYLKGIATTVELRGVFNKEIEFGEDIEEYKKSSKLCSDDPFVPVITISLRVDSGEPERFCFQSSPERAQWLINELRAAIHKVELIEKLFKD